MARLYEILEVISRHLACQASVPIYVPIRERLPISLSAHTVSRQTCTQPPCMIHLMHARRHHLHLFGRSSRNNRLSAVRETHQLARKTRHPDLPCLRPWGMDHRSSPSGAPRRRPQPRRGGGICGEEMAFDRRDDDISGHCCVVHAMDETRAEPAATLLSSAAPWRLCVVFACASVFRCDSDRFPFIHSPCDSRRKLDISDLVSSSVGGEKLCLLSRLFENI